MFYIFHESWRQGWVISLLWFMMFFIPSCVTYAQVPFALTWIINTYSLQTQYTWWRILFLNQNIYCWDQMLRMTYFIFSYSCQYSWISHCKVRQADWSMTFAISPNSNTLCFILNFIVDKKERPGELVNKHTLIVFQLVKIITF